MKGDDGGRHRRRRQVNRVFMSWRFDRPDFLDLESHSRCRARGPDGRYFPPPEVTPLIVVLHKPTLLDKNGSDKTVLLTPQFCPHRLERLLGRVEPADY